MKPFLIVAHRGGARGKFRENTLEAFTYALENGFDHIEMDIRLDYLRKNLYLEHDFLHLPTVKNNRLEKVLPSMKKVTLFTELKSHNIFGKYYAKTFYEMLQKYHLRTNVIVISFNPFVLNELRKLDPKLTLGFLCGNELMYQWMKKYWLKKITPQYLMFSQRIMKREKVDFAHQNDYKILVYVANCEKDWKKAEKLGVDGIVTDYPILAADFYKK